MDDSPARRSHSVTALLLGVLLLVAAASTSLVVWLRPPRTVILLVVDKSGSMAGEPLKYIKESCEAANKELTSKDSIGVLAFDTKPHWVVPISTAGNEARLRDSLHSLGADGGTFIYPALVEALRGFQSDPRVRSARIKHIILLSDGDTPPADFKTITLGMAAEGITLSTVCIGCGSDRFDAPLMSRIADWGQGRFIFTERLQHVPRIFAQETRRVLK
jgi:Ca-activated chloride channel family protein